MRALSIVHQPDAGPGVFAEAIRSEGWKLDAWNIADDADPPADPVGYDAVFSYGGAMHPDQEPEHPWLAPEKALLADLLAREVPLFGVCLGAQILAEAAGVATRRSTVPEIGWYEVELTSAGRDDPVMSPLAPSFEAFGWHSYECPLPPDAVRPGRQRDLPPGLPDRRARLGHPVPRRGLQSRRRILDPPLRYGPGRDRRRHRPGGPDVGIHTQARRLERTWAEPSQPAS